MVIGWVFLAAVPSLGQVLQLTLALPSTTAVLLVHLAFAREQVSGSDREREDDGLPFGLAVAVVLGYLEDQHNGAPTGTLCLAHALTYTGLHWASRRLALPQVWHRAAAGAVALVAVDLVTFGAMMVLAPALDLRRESLWDSLRFTPWRALNTALLVQPVWLLLDWLFPLLRLAPPPPDEQASPRRGA